MISRNGQISVLSHGVLFSPGSPTAPNVTRPQPWRLAAKTQPFGSEHLRVWLWRLLRDRAEAGDIRAMGRLIDRLDEVGRSDKAEQWLRQTAETTNSLAAIFGSSQSGV